MSDSSKLSEYRKNLIGSVVQTRDQVRENRAKKGYVESSAFLTEIKDIIAKSWVLLDDFPFSSFEPDLIERGNFHADIVFKSTKLMSEDKAAYLKEYCPALVTALQKLTTKNTESTPFFEEVKMVGIYVNATIPAEYFFNSLGKVAELGARFGENSTGAGGDIVIDYSSPNAAKHLHAGHIRSTIIGHVLGNIYEASGYTVHRVNYLNDWGGMGILLEGVSVRKDAWDYENKNNFLSEIYTSFRRAQKSFENEANFMTLSESEKAEIVKLIGSFENYEEFSEKYSACIARANEKFAKLENGDDATFDSWKQIVEWSMEDFERFYKLLGIHQEYLTGESLYAQAGKDFVMQKVTVGGAVFFDEKAAEKATALLQIKAQTEEFTEEVLARKTEEIASDIGCYVIPLENGERYVVLKKDGSTIYATRDLAAIEHRMEVFAPKKIIYEVGQEQQEHFDKLFRASRTLKIVSEDTELAHIYHGFYIDETTKKKLSSRDGASNIIKLLQDTISYFYHKYDENTEFTEEEKQNAAKVLGVGSIIFNDIKKDKKSSVAISSDLARMMLQFEESGGAYLVYASCRAKSMLRKYGKTLPKIEEIELKEFKDIEVDLIKKILAFPDAVKRAMLADDPVKIADSITNIASQFNSYYNSTPILKWDRVEQCLTIASAVSQVIDNGLRILHIGSLERI